MSVCTVSRTALFHIYFHVYISGLHGWKLPDCPPASGLSTLQNHSQNDQVPFAHISLSTHRCLQEKNPDTLVLHSRASPAKPLPNILAQAHSLATPFYYSSSNQCTVLPLFTMFPHLGFCSPHPHLWKSYHSFRSQFKCQPL